MRFINKMLEVVYVREQTENEKIGVENAVRMFTEYSVFLNDKRFQGSLELALQYNSEADSKNVPEDVRELIASKLRDSYLATHPTYTEPAIQYQLKF